jgi:hypothetical protein
MTDHRIHPRKEGKGEGKIEKMVQSWKMNQLKTKVGSECCRQQDTNTRSGRIVLKCVLIELKS